MADVNLDAVQELKQLDTMGMFNAAWGLPEQCAQAFTLARAAVLPTDFRPEQIVVTGLGGSAIGGDLLRVFVGNKIQIPVVVSRDYTLPAFINEKTLVFAVSYSGNTEETLSAYQEARERKAFIVAVTTGGKLASTASADGAPLITIPGGISPRSASGYLFIPMLVALERLGLLPDLSAEIEGLVGHLRELREKYRPETPLDHNPAKQMALKLQNHIPVIWAASGTTEVVAQRWKGQVNENAKAPAYWNVFPELNHNEVVGFEVPELLLQKLWLVFLRNEGDHPRVKARMKITEGMVKKAGGITEINSSGPTELARLYSLIYIGDYASMYLAVLYGVDPGPVKVIDYLKGELARI
ncbi:MAG: bifunctional phosphoglucose/phosphomannose isomerase [Clostridia bacterium]|nr:bifunctional phosphoglucose/phosphomannose isomerase [Clostridia bacterium]MDQ7792068.1 bifunctional phosphoglucose/phosphomannose isomerase [Clostridia bacterium]